MLIGAKKRSGKEATCEGVQAGPRPTERKICGAPIRAHSYPLPSCVSLF